MTKPPRRRSSVELGRQWAGGRDVWLRVPGDAPGDERIASVVTKVRVVAAAVAAAGVVPETPRRQPSDEDDGGNDGNDNGEVVDGIKPARNDDDDDDDTSSSSSAPSSPSSAWPRIVRDSVLFGLGACNPRGMEGVHDEATNRALHEELFRDLSDAAGGGYFDFDGVDVAVAVVFWDAFGVWPDGSFEPGYCLAVPPSEQDRGLALATDLAKRYDQGAIYRFRYDGNGNGDGDGTLRRDTIAVLEDADCEATVELVRIGHDDDHPPDLSRFEEWSTTGRVVPRETAIEPS
eukprot:CAMPEP_0197196334 /NCGR_PEP_ID=MMETSP1423-20130617/32303_1 /TAXON_ID=476441 /ORGANISM="Pseudo-nitzschia heimii, Strain UNC1101" /LENGTH=289 /DNA_ID=CAMNT_0042650129 /DNA_START=80 /DNA_END=949 /DNA_ORIENTATION=-